MKNVAFFFAGFSSCSALICAIAVHPYLMILNAAFVVMDFEFAEKF